MVVPPVLVSVPETVKKLITSEAAFVEEILVKFAANIPLVKSNTAPLPFRAISEVVNVPKLEPTISLTLFPMSKPRSVFPDARVIVVPLLVRFGLVPLVDGKALV